MTSHSSPSPDIQHTIDNTMALKCQADTVITLTDESQIDRALAVENLPNKPLIVLSGGSNVLLPPKLTAVVIRPLLTGIEVLDDDESQISIEVMAGENWHNLVVKTVESGWYGLENLALIPGLTGAAPVQNIGAYGVQLEDCLTHVKAWHLPTATWHYFDRSQCQFAYRDSIFKQQAGEWLITRVGFKLHKDSHQVQADYGDVKAQGLKIAQAHGRDQLTANDVMEAIIQIRQSKLPDPARLPNCGSFFKNPVILTEQFVQLQQQFPGIVGYRVDDTHTKVAAGWLIDQAGLKGEGIAPILTHHQQALVLTNHTPADSSHPATQQDVANTQHFIQRHIFEHYGIRLEREPIWIEANGSINMQNAIYTA